MDSICINDLILHVPLIGGAIWPSSVPKLQPIRLSLSIFHCIKLAAAGDDLRHSVDYSKICSLLIRELSLKASDISQNSTAYTLESLLDRTSVLCFASSPSISHLAVEIICDRAPLHCTAIKLEAQYSSPHTLMGQVKFYLYDLHCPIIVGINPCEREEKQTVSVDIEVEQVMDLKRPFNFREIARSLYESMEVTTFKTLEAFTDHIARNCLALLPCLDDSPPIITVGAKKPFALVFASSSEVRITRRHADYRETTSAREQMTLAALAIGSNLGDKVINIENALQLIEQPLSQVPDLVAENPLDPVLVSIVDTSFLYESTPMYVTEQPSFLNAACLVKTTLSPMELLRLLKAVEKNIGRVTSVRNGPRAIDLDIVLFGERIIDTRTLDMQKPEHESLEGCLIVPHPKMSEREFVLRPLQDIIPDFVHPVLGKPIRSLLRDVQPDEALRKVIAFPLFSASNESGSRSHTLWTHPRTSSSSKYPNKTRIMATLNVTPDSFSDGALHNTIDTALEYVEEALKKGAEIIDIGGYSTRPGAAFVAREEEISRVVPAITAIRTRFGGQVLLSVDTFRPEVAEAAIAAGANCINDVYAFTGPESYPFKPDQEAGDHLKRMKALARKTAVPVVLMHSRGDAAQNKEYVDVIEDIKVELGDKVDRIVKGEGGIRRWNVIIDPGVGFSKPVDGNLQILKHARCVICESTREKRNPLAGFPLLIGTSRKSFLGLVLATTQGGRQTDPKDRVWATAAAVACAVQQGAMIARVHDVGEMKDVVDVSQAIWG